VGLIIFSITVNPETREAAFAGNVEPVAALQILQQIVIDQAVQKAKGEVKNEQTDTRTTQEKERS
jgi:hypothetical protein